MMMPPAASRRVFSLCTLWAVAAVSGCTESAAPAVAAHLRLQPDSVAIHVDSTLTASVVLVTAAGDILPVPGATWFVFDSAVASAHGGTLTGLRVGATELLVASDTALVRVPLEVTTGYTNVAPGTYASCGVGDDTRIFCWGFRQWFPALLGPQRGFARIVGGLYEFCALTTAGAAWCFKTFPEAASVVALGNGAETTDFDPVPVSGGHVFRDLAVNNFACGLTTSGQILCWGYTSHFVVGPQSSQQLLEPTNAAPGMTFSAFSLGRTHICGIEATSGDTWCWGNNRFGQVGDTSNVSCLPKGNCADHPTAVHPGLKLVSLAAGAYFTCGLTASGAAWCWGDNDAGQLGDSAPGSCYFTRLANSYTTCSESARQAAPGHAFVSLTAGDGHVCGLQADSTAWCWGANNGAFGNGVIAGGATAVVAANGMKFRSLRAQYGITCGIASNGRAYCWGDDWFNGLGQDAAMNVDQLSPAPVRYQP